MRLSQALAGQGTGTGSRADAGWTPAVVACLGQFMILVNVSIVNVALVVVKGDLHLQNTALQWMAAAYPLAYGLVVVPAGRLGDALGRRPMLWLGLGIFLAGCIVGGTAWNGPSIVAARLLQGLAAGVLNPQILSMLNDNYSGEQRAGAFGLYGATIGVATAAGPALGGVLLDVGPHAWRLLFWTNIPLAILLGAASFRVRFAPRPRERFVMDIVGLALIAAAVLGLIAPFVGLTPGFWWGAVVFVAAVLILGATIGWEHRYAARGGSPLLDTRLLGHAGYRNGVLVGGAYMAGTSAFNLVFSLYLQQELHKRPLVVGLMMVPFALGSALSAIVGRRQVLHSGRTVVVWGAAMVTLGWALSGLAAWVSHGATFFVIVGLTQLFAGLGAGFVLSPNQNLTLGAVDRRQIGAAGGVLQVVQRLGSAIGSSMGTAVFFGVAGGSALAVSAGSSGSSGRALAIPAAVSVGFAVLVLVVSVVDTRRAGGRKEPQGSDEDLVALPR